MNEQPPPQMTNAGLVDWMRDEFGKLRDSLTPAPIVGTPITLPPADGGFSAIWRHAITFGINIVATFIFIWLASKGIFVNPTIPQPPAPSPAVVVLQLPAGAAVQSVPLAPIPAPK